MSIKITEAVFAYCFGVIELFGGFFERTHAIIGLGVPVLAFAGACLFMPSWVLAAIWIFVLGPAAAAALTMLVHGLVTTRRH